MVIIVFIGLNSVIMAMTDYRIECLDRNGDPGRNGIAHDNPNFGAPDPDKCWQNVVGDFTNSWVFGPVFLIEMVCKIFALGFYSEGPHTYLKNNWNILDFVCVMSWIGAQAVPSLSALQSLKMFRLLRPLKSLSKFQGLRRIVVTFMAAFDGLAVTVTLLTFLTPLSPPGGSLPPLSITPQPLSAAASKYQATDPVDDGDETTGQRATDDPRP